MSEIEEARKLSSYLEDASDAAVQLALDKYHKFGYTELTKNWDARIWSGDLTAAIKAMGGA